MDATLSDPLVGRRIDGRYRVLARIGRGGMGVVYRAEDERLEREVAVKVLRADLAHDLEARQRFVREAKSAARLAHPGVVSVLDQGTDGETAYLVMELVGGRTLRDVVHERGLLTPGEALDVAEAVLDALAEAHRKGVLHRDVKPANVLVADDGRVKVADFGLARSAAATRGSTGGNGAELMGTAEYLAPERVARGVADARSDLYGVGVLLFEMLTGQPPFSGDSPVRLAYRHVYDDAPSPSSLVPGLPPALDAIVLKALAKDPDDRPADAVEMLADLRALHADLTPAQLSARGALPAGSGDPSGATVKLDLAAVAAAGPAAADAAPADGAAPVSRAREEDVGYGPGGRRRRRSVIAMVVTLVVLAVAAGVVWFFLAGPGAFTTTPQVAGSTPTQARTTLARAGFAVDERQEFSDTVPAGTVVGTDPAAGRDVRKEGTITVLVSKGVEQFAVPAVAGTTRSAAEKAVTDAGLVVGDVAEAFDEQVPEGSVVASTPAAGVLADHDSRVDLVVSQGREPIGVPRVVGSSVGDARAAITGAGLVAGEPRTETSETVPAGDVIAQSPSTGSLFRGDTVQLTVSSGPPLVAIPKVQGQQLGAARATLERLGFEVAVQNVLGGLFGTVRDCSPAAGSSAPKGSTVTLTVV
ncbi:Stk1 family PASTA domain-containing Ser/Thr kinase [Kineococcus rubinsiae]|uniref:Stk1 family PASTA domain-containing Ser/Thr kinase n=1 Tax=Kineococcus rubinsiae TaxID=2609562 RepID=UPI001431476C|nr:Stk1 family PASTA domain-containing Ser/Thr kinase [Kineococcus rubinsiae]NIZ93600.1 Stk1 family PASTA domain-containing Ser/Thr kinase [Kineococcus rubinsiae]